MEERLFEEAKSLYLALNQHSEPGSKPYEVDEGKPDNIHMKDVKKNFFFFKNSQIVRY